jgi:putative transposon-encoded protein
MFMVRKVEINQSGLCLVDSEIEGFLERTVTPIGTSAKADIPKRYLGRRVYVIITREEEVTKE